MEATQSKYSNIDKNNIKTLISKCSIGNCNIIFDFITEQDERNKGNYLRILYLISKKFRNKTLMIYSQSNNYYSKKAIVKAGFVFKKRL